VRLDSTLVHQPPNHLGRAVTRIGELSFAFLTTVLDATRPPRELVLQRNRRKGAAALRGVFRAQRVPVIQVRAVTAAT
jgi:hypothetical protein